MIMFVYPKRNNNFTPMFFVRLATTQFTTESSNTKSNRYKNKKNCHKNFHHPFFVVCFHINKINLITYIKSSYFISKCNGETTSPLSRKPIICASEIA